MPASARGGGGARPFLGFFGLLLFPPGLAGRHSLGCRRDLARPASRRLACGGGVLSQHDRLGGIGDLDPELLEALLHAPVELALNTPAAGIGTSDLADDRHHGAVDLVDAPELAVAP